MNAHSTDLLPRSEIASVCRHRDLALAKRRAAAEALEAAWATGDEADQLEKVATMGAEFYGRDRSDQIGALFRPRGWDLERVLEDYRKSLDAKVWTHLIDACRIREMMDAEALKELNESLRGDVIEATEDNVRATLEGLVKDRERIFKRGLANAFSGLDRRFKSHNGFKIGSRIIFDRAFDRDHGFTTWGSTWDTIADVERIMAILDGQAPTGRVGIKWHVEQDRRGGGIDPRQSVTEGQFFTLKAFKNGNAHLWFRRDDLVEKANKLLAEWYGEVVPDAYDEGDPDSGLFNRSNLPAKDLQFYPTPAEVSERLVRGLALDGADVLEPSAGQGSIAFAAAERGARVHGIEVNPLHVDALRGQIERRDLQGQVTVEERNFLAVEPSPSYGFVLMNPPFYGQHWQDHVRHAFRFLRPGGILRAVLPASAEVNEGKRHEAFRKWAERHGDYSWRSAFEDLPEGSFRESGTNINTVILHLRAPRA